MNGPPPERPTTPIPPEISDRIKIARVIGILGVVLIHAPPWRVDLGEPPRPIGPFDLIFLYCQELFGRASVPLLSIISGYLMTRQDRGAGTAARLARKSRSLLVPLLCWNLIAVLLGMALDRVFPEWSLLEWGNELLALADEPAILPLYFLRDMFICAILYPLLKILLARAPVATLLLALLVTLTGWSYPVIIGSGPLPFFMAGIAIALGKLRWTPGVAACALTVAAALAAPVLTTALLAEMLVRPADDGWADAGFTAGLLAERVFGAGATWLLAGWILRGRWGGLVKGIEPVIFLTFCSHVLWLGLAWHLLTRMGFGYGHPFYPLFFLSAPLQALAAALLLEKLLRHLAPRAVPLLCGGRIPRPPSWRLRAATANSG